MHSMRTVPVALLAASVSGAYAQSEDALARRNPFLGNERIAGSAEIVTVFSGGGTIHSTILDYDLLGLMAGPEASQSGSSFSMPEVITGDYDGDRQDDIVVAYPGVPPTTPPRNPRLHLLVPTVDEITHAWTGQTVTTVRDKLAERFTVPVRGAAGHFDEDPAEELLLAFHSAEERIRLSLFDFDDDVTPRQVGSIVGPSLSWAVLQTSALFDVAVGDLDGDGLSEVVLLTVEADFDGAGRWGLVAEVYDCDPSAAHDSQRLERRIRQLVFDETRLPSSTGFDVLRLDVTTGNLGGTARHEIVIGFQVSEGGGSGDETTTYLQTAAVDDALSALVLDDANLLLHASGSGNPGQAMTLLTEDFQGDGRDDVFALGLGLLGVYEPNDSLLLTRRASIGASQPGATAHRAVEIADLDARQNEDSWRSEVIVAGDDGSGNTTVNVHAMAVVDSTGAWILPQQDVISVPRSSSSASIAVADVDRDAVRLGTPVLTTSTDIVQPIVVLNAPPVHFDVVDGGTHDVSGCFGAVACGFEATYTEGLSQATQVTTKVHGAWALDSRSFFFAEFAGSKFNTTIQNHVGASFDLYERRTRTITVGVDVRAVHDDLIYATVADYDFWEYPVYGYGRSEPLGFMVSVIPRITENRWFPAKSWSGNVFAPNHEVGNILSYERDIPDNPDVLEEIKGTSFNTYSLGSRTAYRWTLEFSDFEEVGAAVDLSYGFKVGQLIQIGQAGEISVEGDLKPLGVGVSVGTSTEYAFGFGTEVSASFDRGETTTHTTSVQRNLKLGVALGSVADDEKAYVVKPYAYWSDYGALVVDYACWPELASPGYTTNWWQDTYGWASDPAFALPWRHDRAKGLELLDDLKASQTRDIQFAPKNPRPGERVLIVARVRNYALLPTPGPVSVHFFRGNPADGGTPIVSDRGFLSAEVGPIPERGQATARFVWVVPDDILPFERIYAVLDRDDRYEEIHDANNLAWNVLGADDPSADLAGAALRGGVELLGTYPNPFRPPTTIRYALARRGAAHVRIFDVTGALVRTLRTGPHARGTHRVQWDGRSDGGGLVGSGIYFYEVRSGSSAESGKIVMVR